MMINETVKNLLDMYNRGGVEALKNLLESIMVSTEGLDTLGRDDVIEIIKYAITSVEDAGNMASKIHMQKMAGA